MEVMTIALMILTGLLLFGIFFFFTDKGEEIL